MGSEQEQKQKAKEVITELRRSPSHTVGSEHDGKGIKSLPTFQSPSHTVGLERTLEKIAEEGVLASHHPTRWARNKQNPTQEGFKLSVLVTIPHGGLGTQGGEVMKQNQQGSPSHTVGSEPQITTLNKIRHINHFVKVVPLSNEVNFPKSEIMQS